MYADPGEKYTVLHLNALKVLYFHALILSCIWHPKKPSSRGSKCSVLFWDTMILSTKNNIVFDNRELLNIMEVYSNGARFTLVSFNCIQYSTIE